MKLQNVSEDVGIEFFKRGLESPEVVGKSNFAFFDDFPLGERIGYEAQVLRGEVGAYEVVVAADGVDHGP